MSQNILKSDLKSPGFVLFWANLTYFGAKPDITGLPIPSTRDSSLDSISLTRLHLNSVKLTGGFRTQANYTF